MTCAGQHQRLLSARLVELAKLDREARREWLLSMPPEVRRRIPYVWEFWARPDQVWRPGDEMITLVQAGRGWGKTLYGAQAVRWVAEHPEVCGFGRPPLTEAAPIIALVGRTSADAIATMIKGPSGIMACSPPWFRPKFKPSERLLVWPNGMRAYYFSAETPEQLRGPNIGFVWGDEIAFWRATKGFQVGALENIEHALRKGLGRAIYTTTPLPTAAMYALHERANRGRPVQVPGAADAASDAASPPRSVEEVESAITEVISAIPPDVRIIRGSSLDNAANQDARWVARQRAKRGTRIGRQEVDGELLTGNPRTLFPYELLNARRVELPFDERREGESIYDFVRRVLQLDRVCVAADPNGSEDAEGAEFGISVAGTGRDGREYTLQDLSGHHGPHDWPELLYDAALFWRADAIVAETNYGGSMIRAAVETHVRKLIDRGLPYIPVPFVEVTTGRSGKAARLKVFAQAMEAGLVYSAGDPSQFAVLEAQLHAFDPAEHPDKQVARVEVRQPDGSLKMETLLLDRLDARVWAHLFLSGHEIARSQTLFMLGDSLRKGAAMLASLT